MAKITVAVAMAVAVTVIGVAQGRCSRGCDLALGSYYIVPNINLTYILNLFNNVTNFSGVRAFNSKLVNENSISSGTRINIPFSCECLSLGEDYTYLGHLFQYMLTGGDTYESIAGYYANLTSTAWLKQVNSYDELNIPDGAPVNVSVNCSCGDPAASKDYGFFLSYPLQTTDNLTSLAQEFDISSTFLSDYNLNFDFSEGQGIAFIPVKGQFLYLPL